MRNVFTDHAVRVTGHDLGRRLADQLREHGLVTFDGITTRADALELAGQIMRLWQHRDSEPDGITVLADRGRSAAQPGQAGFGTTALDLHTESSTAEQPPQLMMLTCISSAATGGACRLADGQVVFKHLRDQLPDLLELLCQPRSVLFGGAAGFLGSVFDIAGDRRVRVRLRTDQLAKFSPQLTHRLPTLRRAISECAVTLPLMPGQGYLLCNSRWLHGRDAFEGDHLMYRLLGDPLPTLDVTPGFALAAARASR